MIQLFSDKLSLKNHFVTVRRCFKIFFNKSNGFFSDIKQISSLLTVKFFNVVQK